MSRQVLEFPMPRRIWNALILICAGYAATAAQAADLPLITKSIPVAAAASWEGYFVGGNIGGGGGSAKFFDIFPVPDGVVDADPHTKGWLGGIQAGYNHQFGQWLLGVQSDFSWSGVKSSFSCFPFGDQRCSGGPDWFATVTGRAGVIFGSTLLYVKGGAAWAHDSFTDVATCAGSQSRFFGGIPAVCGDSFAGSGVRSGWTVGAGLEYLLAGPWSLFIEYDYMNFGQSPITLYDGLGNAFPEDIRQTVSLVKAGVDYHFGTAPLVAHSGDADDERPSHLLAFTGVDVAKQSVDGWIGGLLALRDDLDTSGWRVYLLGESGAYKYSGGGTNFRGNYSSGELLAGYGFEGDNYSANLLVGFNAINQKVTPYDFDNRVQGTEGGAKIRGDIWINPTPQTLAYGEAEYSTAFQTYYTSGKLGYDISNGKQVFVGPMVSFLGDERFNQWRVGAHVTQVQFGPIQMDISAGYAKDSVVGSGAFSKLELSTNF